ncbi:hypothetical protein J1N35_004232, partial [Gossypium stocksii]
MVKLPHMIRMLLALMDEAYTGSTIGDGGGDSGSEESCTVDIADPLFVELIKDEKDGLAERHWTPPGVAAVLQAATNSPQADRLKQILNITPRLLHMYFTISLRDAKNYMFYVFFIPFDILFSAYITLSLGCSFILTVDTHCLYLTLCSCLSFVALIPILMARNSILFPDKNYMYEVSRFVPVGRRLLEFMLASFQRSPDFIALLKVLFTQVSPHILVFQFTELGLQLCWAVGEHGGGGGSHKDAGRELFESLELLLYENLSS